VKEIGWGEIVVVDIWILVRRARLSYEGRVIVM
jgi:hypothetical protein